MKRIVPLNEPTRYTVYFAGALDKVKIGCSIKPVDRILQVGEWIPFPITMLATIKGNYTLEATLHRMFAEEWSHGEWFNASPRLLAFIETVKSGGPVVVECRSLDEGSNRRRKAIADKKRIARKRHLIPASLLAEIDRVAPGQEIPAHVLSAAWSAISTPTPEASEAA